jgi:NADH dehydrogenase
VVGTARPQHSAYVHRFLERRGVVVRLGSPVSKVERKRLHLASGEVLDAFTLLWTAGVRAPDLVTNLPLAQVRDGRVQVDDRVRAIDLEGKPVENVYVIGDCAASRRADGTLQPRLSQTAVAMGGYLGESLVRQASGKPVEPFGFRDAGYIISLGKHSSVVDLFGIPFSGRLAWLLWAGAYLVKMVGVRKQLEVGIDHLTHLMFEHDSAQILQRRHVLSDEEINLSLAPGAGEREPETAAR